MAIKKEYDFKERLNGSSFSEESSLFTVHNLDTSENNEASDDLSKSDVLAPFNTNEDNSDKFLKSIEPMIVSRKMLKFSSKLREVNRKYERDNNSNIDNGVYIQGTQLGSPRMYSAKSTATTTIQTASNQIDKQVLEKMERMGFDKTFVLSSLNSGVHNNATTCYYLMVD
jgi:hypothetical protein